MIIGSLFSNLLIKLIIGQKGKSIEEAHWIDFVSYGKQNDFIRSDMNFMYSRHLIN